MFQSSRFTTVVTQDTRDRLTRAVDNSKPVARGETHRGAVTAIQAALAELNSGYLVGAEVDGYFGNRTSRAVEVFQRDYGLIADGVVGRQVLTQLDSIYSGTVRRAPHGVSVHIGVDRVDPGHYGDPMTLPSCENDAKAMRDLAESIGYDTLLFVNEQATTANFCAFLRSAAVNLFAGDSMFATFSGHGGRLPNASDDEEPDLLDETLCFYDRMLLDDELYAMLGDLREGVRVHVVFDSCHSGTALKNIMITPDEAAEEQRRRYVEGVATALSKTLPFTGAGPDAGEGGEDGGPSPIPIVPAFLEKALDGEKPELVDPPKGDAAKDEVIAALFGDLYHDTSFGKGKFLEGTQVYDRNKAVYDTVLDLVGSKAQGQLPCTVTSLSACDDPQTTPAGNPLSLFTFNLTQAWSGGYPGSYSQFLRALRERSRPDATPQLNAYGSGGALARLHERPFVF
ncbi:peptidoglycan-binding protein [Blastococcus deserti]|uniref:Peptidoglycan-binding protein n=1 Tax=Blastococcus deserti TaxID=2259033 RepID=A0ABW4X9K9_9ACTN